MAYLLIRNATIIDGTGKPPIPRAAVLVEDNRIHSVGTEKTLSISGKKAIEIDVDQTHYERRWLKQFKK